MLFQVATRVKMSFNVPGGNLVVLGDCDDVFFPFSCLLKLHMATFLADELIT